MIPEDYGIIQILDCSFVDFDFYKYPDDVDEWLECPFCHCKPKVWEYDNGRFTACGCLKREWCKYDHFLIQAESIMSILKRTRKTEEYDRKGLKKNWNHFCETGEISFTTTFGKDGSRW